MSTLPTPVSHRRIEHFALSCFAGEVEDIVKTFTIAADDPDKRMRGRVMCHGRDSMPPYRRAA